MKAIEKRFELAERLKDKIKRKKDELADTSEKEDCYQSSPIR